MKFSMGDINIMLLGNFELYENRFSKSHILLKVVNLYPANVENMVSS